MSITGFYDALSVKTWTENRLDAFQAYCAVQFAHNQETFMISVHRYLYACAVHQGTMFLNSSMYRGFLYVRYSFLLISNKFCDLSLLHWPLPRMAFAWRLDIISPKTSIFPGPNPIPLALVMDLPASKALRTGTYKS
jgi:hypothetical protein